MTDETQPAAEPKPVAAPSNVLPGPAPAAPPEPPATPEARRASCERALAQVLRHYQCKLVAFILPPEQVGSGPPTKVMLTANVALVAEE